MIDENVAATIPEPAGLTVTCRVSFGRGARGRKSIQQQPINVAPAPQSVPELRLPSVTRALVKAHVYQRMLDSGTHPKALDLAYKIGMTDARLSQLLALIGLSTVIQAAVLALPPCLPGDDPVTERELRKIAADPDWGEQARLWALATAKADDRSAIAAVAETLPS